MRIPDSSEYIVIGAGSAGCVMATRLAQAGHDVVLVEAGPRDHPLDYRVHMPAALSHVLASHTYNWHYETEAEPGMQDRRLFCPRGRTLGGSSSINGMIFVRGNAADFDRWASLSGYSNWDYASCLPYFKRSEHAPFGNARYRGVGGPMRLSRGDLANPLFGAFLEAGVSAGYALRDDLNGEYQEGVGAFDRTIYRGARWSTSRGYLDRVRDASNLKIVTGRQVARLLFEGDRATGVEFEGDGTRIMAGREIIVSAGAINSPWLLLRSGIGAADELAKHGIACIADLPGVGKHLQDHLEVYVQVACRRPVSLYPALKWYNQAWIGPLWYLARKGPGATNHFETGGFIRSDESVDYPDLQLHFLPVAMKYDGTGTAGRHGYQVHVGPMKPTSRGDVTLDPRDPRRPPRIRFNYAATEADRVAMRRGIRLVREILAQPAFTPFDDAELMPGDDVRTDSEIDAFVSRYGESAYHPCGTCRMGTGDEAVVDDAGRVHGTTGLRVVDASIMPEITNGNLNAPVIMLAEKIANTMAQP
ncbi:MAG: choline dehydrogenase [Pseudomonadales bacterium]|nr:choline dehydrogenase [Pseudomonadales bacterium]